MIAIVDYGVGNLGSILNMFKKIGVAAAVTSAESDLFDSKGIVLPGVGAFDRGMENLRSSGLVPPLTKLVEVGRPLLGVCLGMQLLTAGSDEGKEAGFGWIDGRAHRFEPADRSLKVPHMGWNTLQTTGLSPLFQGIDDPRFYFLHSYYVTCEDRSQALGVTDYGIPFDSAVGKDNVFGVQFHPEKSHRFGMQLFRNFAALTG